MAVSCFALHHYAGPDASMIAESLYTLSFRKKLEAIPSVVTGNRLVLNRSSAAYAALCELINARNALIHNRPSVEPVEWDEDSVVESFTFCIPERALRRHPSNFGVAKCRRFRAALLKFTQQVHDGAPWRPWSPESLQPCELLVAVDAKSRRQCTKTPNP